MNTPSSPRVTSPPSTRAALSGTAHTLVIIGSYGPFESEFKVRVEIEKQGKNGAEIMQRNANFNLKAYQYFRKSNEIIKATHKCELYEALCEEAKETSSSLGGFQTASALLAGKGEEASSSSRAGGGFQKASSLLRDSGASAQSQLPGVTTLSAKSGVAAKSLASGSERQSAMAALGTGFKSARQLREEMEASVVSVKYMQSELSDKVKNDLFEISERYSAANPTPVPPNGSKSILKTFSLKSENSGHDKPPDTNKILKVSPKPGVMTIDFSKWRNQPEEIDTTSPETDAAIVFESSSSKNKSGESRSTHFGDTVPISRKEPIASQRKPRSSSSESSQSKRKLDLEFYKDHAEARKRKRSSASSELSKASLPEPPPPKTEKDRAEEKKKLSALKAECYKRQREGVADCVIKLLQPLYDKQCIPNKEIFKKTARALTHQFVKRGIFQGDTIHFKVVQLCNTGTVWDESLLVKIRDIK